ncbi:hypothetical protein [Kineosporia babensis]|uniref:Uncharacterized protein n=1 Tax=Kineosporia babensis TaxID=499548 RepID=A0A9X1T0Y7_9ACTN|nr:hypothetical protein [Kineosporia babensis]MCD5313288.1 hypothetical protein [Kineosporia babensis]
MTPNSIPVTAPTETVRMVRQGRPGVHRARPEPAGSEVEGGPGRHVAPGQSAAEPSFEVALTRMLEQAPDVPVMSDRPLVIKQRIARDRESLRRLRRTLPDLTDRQQRFETESAMRDLTQQIQAGRHSLDLLVQAGRARRWGPSDFEPGDQACFLSAWCEVLDVGPVGLTVRLRRPHGGSWSVPAEYTKVTGRRRNGVEDVDAA